MSHSGNLSDDSDFTAPTAEELISVENIHDIDARWVDIELSHLSKLSVENFSSWNKPQLLQRLNEEAQHATQVKNLIRVLCRLAKTNATSKKLCDDVIQAVNTKLNSTELDNQNTYANALKLPGQKVSKPENPATISPQRPVQELSPTAPIFTPSPRNEITIIPKKDYNSDVKAIQKTLERSQVSNTRKSRSGNIVLSFPSINSMKSAQTVLEAKPSIKIHTHEKTFPKLTIRNVDLPEDEVKSSILMKNSRIKSLVDDGYHFEVLFIQKVKLYNSTTQGGNGIEVCNAVIKVDPIIRNCIKENKFKIFVGLKNCNVFDRVHYKICHNCQKIGSHTTDKCPTADLPVCKYCAHNHKSFDCDHKNDPNKQKCSNCANSDDDSIKAEAKNHTANSKNCPFIVDIYNSVILNTQYEAVNQKND